MITTNDNVPIGRERSSHAQPTPSLIAWTTKQETNPTAGTHWARLTAQDGPYRLEVLDLCGLAPTTDRRICTWIVTAADGSVLGGGIEQGDRQDDSLRDTAAAAAHMCAYRLGTGAAGSTHRDAELLATFKAFRAFDAAFALDPEGSEQPDEEREVLFKHWIVLAERMKNFKANTLEGLNALALMAVRETESVKDARQTVEEWFLNGQGDYRKPEIIDNDPVTHILWNISESIKRMVGRQERKAACPECAQSKSAVPENICDIVFDIKNVLGTAQAAITTAIVLDQHDFSVHGYDVTGTSNAHCWVLGQVRNAITSLNNQWEKLFEMVNAHRDPFAEAVAGFEAEAPAMLALPVTPSLSMVEAGAAAAGINPDTARAVYAAMAQAGRTAA
ncbi:hypothetical protein M2352_000336 [Azospirillum fermentarium]|uniref:hypothetical protein n=1 Tax=Azospirillum fermentarium TaxID=1233114 RepID=UPI0022262064|nr:hypothetical protein [Azospirillum fermentarium]MCW2244745.1 hypothetical protein [Azospirillum fermentarium]